MSNQSFFNTIKNEMVKTKVITIFSCIIFFFLIPVLYIISFCNVKTKLNPGNHVADTIMFNYGGMGCAAAIALLIFAVFVAYTQFDYLFRKNSVDYYNSVPVGRTKMFFAQYINGILTAVVPYTFFYLLGILIGVCNGCSSVIVKPFFYGYILNIVFFLIIYSLCVVAILCTGNAYGAVFGMLVLNFIIPFTSFFLYSYFDTIVKTNSIVDKIIDKLFYFSPAIEYNNVFNKFYLPKFIGKKYGYYYVESNPTIDMFPVRFAIYIVVIALLSLAAYKMYKLRKMEKAGDTVIYPVIKRIVRIYFTFIAGMGCVIYMIDNFCINYIWKDYDVITNVNKMNISTLIIFILLTAIVMLAVHIIIQLVFKSDIRKIFTNWIELLICYALIMSLFAVDYLYFINM